MPQLPPVHIIFNSSVQYQHLIGVCDSVYSSCVICHWRVSSVYRGCVEEACSLSNINIIAHDYLSSVAALLSSTIFTVRGRYLYVVCH